MAKKYLEINYAEIKKGNSKYTDPKNKLKPASWLWITAYINAVFALIICIFMVTPQDNPNAWTEIGQGMLMLIYGALSIVSLPVFIGMIKYLRHTTQGDAARTGFVAVFLINAITVISCLLTYLSWDT